MTEQTTTIDGPVLVVGATGKQGGATARALLEGGVPVRALVRDPESERAKALTELGATLAVGDLYDQATLAEACAGVRAVFTVFMPDMAKPEADSERVQARNIVGAARAAQVPHLVHTSVSGAEQYEQAPGWAEGRWHRSYSEQAAPISDYFLSKSYVDDLVRTAGFPTWTILRPTTFMEMYRRPSVYFEGFTGDRLMAVADPDTVVKLIAVADIGRTAAAALTDPAGFDGVELHLAGDVLTHNQIAEVLSRAWSERILAPELPMSPEQALTKGMVAPIVQATEWNRDVGHPAADPDQLRAHGIDPLTLEAWAQTTPGR
jgi:uncharacterized protein YbjT (DUF2867 family)